MNLEKHEIEKMHESADEAASFLKGLANPDRLLILCQLAEGEKNVSELIESTGLAQTSMSQHLARLKEDHIVSARRDHRHLFYSISNQAVFQIMAVLYETFCKNQENKEKE